MSTEGGLVLKKETKDRGVTGHRVNTMGATGHEVVKGRGGSRSEYRGRRGVNHHIGTNDRRLQSNYREGSQWS